LSEHKRVNETIVRLCLRNFFAELALPFLGESGNPVLLDLSPDRGCHSHFKISYHGEEGCTHWEALQIRQGHETRNLTPRYDEPATLNASVPDEGEYARVGANQVFFRYRRGIPTRFSVGGLAINERNQIEETNNPIIVDYRNMVELICSSRIRISRQLGI
jgi:hypothetical protein